MFRAMAECHDSNTHYPKLPKFWADSSYVIDSIMAVRVGFEPTEPVKVQRFSRPPDSTALAPHRIGLSTVCHSCPRLSLALEGEHNIFSAVEMPCGKAKLRGLFG